MSFTLHLSSLTRKHLYRRLQQASAPGALKLVKRLHTLLALAEDTSVSEIAAMLNLGPPTVHDSRQALLLKGATRLVYKRSPGRPSK